jgi:hypothetical protein
MNAILGSYKMAFLFSSNRSVLLQQAREDVAGSNGGTSKIIELLRPTGVLRVVAN